MCLAVSTGQAMASYDRLGNSLPFFALRLVVLRRFSFFFFFLNNPAPPKISPLPLPAALPISEVLPGRLPLPSGLPPAPPLRRRAPHALGDPERLRAGGVEPPCRGVPLAQRLHHVFERHRHVALHVDRKSTRLNSSHGYISYAVFCLKKKKHPAQA